MRSVTIFASLALATSSIAQTSGSAAFEVASVKPAAPPTDGRIMVRMSRDPGRVNYTNVSLKNLLAQAYHVKDYQVSGPDWLDTERFDVVAKMPEASNNDQIAEMVKTLLAERFKVAAHKESKVMPAYALVVAKGGSKVTLVDEKPSGLRMMMGPKGRHMSGKTSMDLFANMLANWVDRPVLDLTELKGVYDLDLEWSGDEGPAAMRGMRPGPPPGGGGSPEGAPRHPDESADAPSLFTAIQEKLGLRLDSRKAPVDILVIDHVERTPSDN